MRRWVALAACAAFVFGWACGKRASSSAPVRVTYSKVTFTVGYGEAVFEGTYTFHNQTGAARTEHLFLAFVPLAEAEPPEVIKVEGATYTPADTGVFIDVTLEKNADHVVTIDYQQVLKGTRATYVLAQPRFWPGPIDDAVIIVRASRTLRDVNLSYHTEEAYSDPVWHIRLIKQKGFLPTSDLVVTWREPNR